MKKKKKRVGRKCHVCNGTGNRTVVSHKYIEGHLGYSMQRVATLLPCSRCCGTGIIPFKKKVGLKKAPLKLFCTRRNCNGTPFSLRTKYKFCPNCGNKLIKCRLLAEMVRTVGWKER